MTRRFLLFFILPIWLFLLGIPSFFLSQKFSIFSTNRFSKDPLYRLIGSVKEVFGDTAFLKADSYFHGGVDTGLLRHETIENEAHGPEANERDTFKKAYTDWVYKINSQVKVLEHRHLQGEETKEILPLSNANPTPESHSSE